MKNGTNNTNAGNGKENQMETTMTQTDAYNDGWQAGAFGRADKARLADPDYKAGYEAGQRERDAWDEEDAISDAA
jgi:hypothetical protein